jgi:endoglucanase
MDKTFLKEIIQCISPSGKEAMLQKYLYKHYKNDFESFTVEEQGTLTAAFNTDNDFKILLAAHADEISLIVTGYNSDGSLAVERNGGVRPKLYIGTKVKILTPNGIVNGIVGTNSGLQKKADVSASDLFIDIGCDTKDEAMAVVPKGSYIVHDTDMMELQNDRLAGRAFDDRIGVYIIFEAAKKAAQMGAKAGVYTVATTGEETSGRGAYSSASKIKPSVCVAVDVTYATDYAGAAEAGDVSLGKGGVICRGSIPNAKLNDLLEECAKELNLPVQFEVFAGRTGTDADTMLKTCDGIPQVLFSIPLRYMHSPVETLSISDVDSMVDILALFITKLSADYDLMPYSLED